MITRPHPFPRPVATNLQMARYGALETTLMQPDPRRGTDRGLYWLMAFVAVAAVALALMCAPAFAQVPGPPSPPPEVPTTAAKTVINAAGLVGEFYAPATPGRHPAILVLGGSEGGLQGSAPLARRLANEGYATFAVAYFGAPGRPGVLDRIPMEDFRAALDWLEARPEVDGTRIGVVGVSKGAEIALLLASAASDIKVVVAGAPSSVVWQSLDFTAPNASWAEGGKPMAYVPYDGSRPFSGLLDLYRRSLATLPDHGDAIIPVERINGPVLLVSGEDDQMWPSSAMGRQIEARLAARRFAHPVSHLAYPHAGHGVFGAPIAADNPRAASLARFGGTVDGNLAARADGWPRVLAFLRAALRP